MAQRNYREEALTSPLAYRILSTIAREDSISPTEIANKIDSSPKTVSNYLKGLREHKFVYISDKEGRKKLYKVDYELISDYHHERWLNLREEYGEKEDERLKSFFGEELYESAFKDPHIPESEKEKLKTESSEYIEDQKKLSAFHVRYFANYFRRNQESTIEDMLVEDYASAMLYFVLITEDAELKESWLAEYLWVNIGVFLEMTKVNQIIQSVRGAYLEVEESKNVEELLPDS